MERNFIKVLGTVATLLISYATVAQDIHFSQFRQSPLTLNPANTGALLGDFRVGANYRTQWGKVLDNPINTVSLGFDKPFFINDYDRIGVGVVVVNDQAGDLGFNTNRIGLSGSYLKLLGNQEIRIGVQAAYTIRSIDNKLSFPEGFNKVTGEFDPSLTQMEPLTKLSSGYFDANLGIAWAGYFGDFRPEVGLAGFHLNGPKETFFSDADVIAVKIVAHGTFKYFVTKEIFVDPNFLVASQAKTKNVILGVNGGMNLKDNDFRVSSIFAGVGVRNGFSENSDAIILRTGATVGTFDFGVSYDVNTSALRAGVSGNGSLEFSLIFTAPATRITKTLIDSERL